MAFLFQSLDFLNLQTLVPTIGFVVHHLQMSSLKHISSQGFQ